MLLFQSELPPWFVPVLVAVCSFLAAVIATLTTWLTMRPKTKADTIKVMSDASHLLAEQLKKGVVDLTLAMATITRIEKEKTLFGRMADDAETRAAKAVAIIELLQIEAASIAENISHMSFVPTGEITKSDQSAIRRLQEIRDSAERMQAAI